jgi:hypothetical protein
LAPALISLGARIRIAGLAGNREIPLEEFYQKPEPENRRMTVLQQGELLTEVFIPQPPHDSRGIYLKAMDRKAWAFALASAAIQLRVDGDLIKEARIILGGVAPIPWRVRDAENILQGRKLTKDNVAEAADAGLRDARPLRDRSGQGRAIPSAISLGALSCSMSLFLPRKTVSCLIGFIEAFLLPSGSSGLDLNYWKLLRKLKKYIDLFFGIILDFLLMGKQTRRRNFSRRKRPLIFEAMKNRKRFRSRRASRPFYDHAGRRMRLNLSPAIPGENGPNISCSIFPGIPNPRGNREENPDC